MKEQILMISLVQKERDSIWWREFLMIGGKLKVWMVGEKVWFLVIMFKLSREGNPLLLMRKEIEVKGRDVNNSLKQKSHLSQSLFCLERKAASENFVRYLYGGFRKIP